jgi:hypothetical protein
VPAGTANVTEELTPGVTVISVMPAVRAQVTVPVEVLVMRTRG